MTDPSPPDIPNPESTSWPMLTIDYALFEKLLEDTEISEEDKRQFIETWWNLIINFVDLGFGIHPLQQACDPPEDLSALTLSDVLGIEDKAARGDFAEAAAKGGTP